MTRHLATAARVCRAVAPPHSRLATAAVLTLAVGIAATTAICTVVNAILLQPLPVRDADRLVRIVENERPSNIPPISYGEYLDWQSRTTTLEGLAAVTFNPNVVMQTPAGLVRVTAGYVSANYFEVLGARAQLGRTLVSADAANPDALVLGYDAWRRHFGSDPRVIGSVVHVSAGGLAGRSLTVVGVLAESMETIDAPMDCFTPIAAGPDVPTFASVAVGFAAVAAFASYVPALRATRLDPIEALRIE